MHYEIGKDVFESGTSYINSRLEKVNYVKIRRYFNVDNAYIMKKLRLIFFPFKYSETNAHFPEDHLYRPDLYLPTFSLVTLVLLKGFRLGLRKMFFPEDMFKSLSRNFFFHLLLSFIYKSIGYLMSTPIGYLDIVAVTGYKFVVSVLIHLFCSYSFGWIFSLYFFVTFFFFESRSLKEIMNVKFSAKNQLYLLFGVVAFESLTMFFIAK